MIKNKELEGRIVKKDIYSEFYRRSQECFKSKSKRDFWHRTPTAGSDVVQSGRPIFDDFFQHLWPYIGNNTANVVFQMVKRLWLIRIDQ
ncbi:adhesion G protein-coupled receptor B2 [Trichonephila clavipes]|nr:adhesion G protein-coupled receptor B2 [Trichonephila clavipes]